MKNKTKKIIKRFFAWLYVGAMSVPLLSLLYHQLGGFDAYFKSNAEEIPQVYYEKVNYQTNELNTIDDFVVGNLYYLKWNVITNTSNNIVLDICRFDSLNFLYFDYVNTDVPLNSIIRIRSSVASVDSSVILFTYNSINYYYFGTYLIFDNNTIVFPYIYVQNATSNLLEYSVAVPQEDLQNYYYFVERTTENQFIYDDAFGKTYLDFAYNGGYSYDSYYENVLTGNTYTDAMSYYVDNVNDDYSSLLFSYDYLGLMGYEGTFNQHRGAWALFVNYYINYLINMSLILFMPEILMLFICWCRDLIYAMTDKEGGF